MLKYFESQDLWKMWNICLKRLFLLSQLFIVHTHFKFNFPLREEPSFFYLIFICIPTFALPQILFWCISFVGRLLIYFSSFLPPPTSPFRLAHLCFNLFITSPSSWYSANYIIYMRLLLHVVLTFTDFFSYSYLHLLCSCDRVTPLYLCHLSTVLLVILTISYLFYLTFSYASTSSYLPNSLSFLKLFHPFFLFLIIFISTYYF